MKPNTHNIFKISAKPRVQGGYYQRQTYSNKLYIRKRRHSHKRIQPKNRIPKIDAKKHFGKTTLKIIKPKRYDEDESESESNDFEEKLMKFPRFKAKYGKIYNLKKNNKNKFFNVNGEHKMGDTRKTNLTISEVDEEEEKNNKNKKRKLSEIKKKGKIIMDKKIREILGKQYKYLVDDPLNPYGTSWPSNFLKAGYDAGLEYDDFQSGVPVLRLKNLAKKQLPPIKKKGLNFKNDNSIYSSNKNVNGYPGTSAKKNLNEENWDIKTNKTENIKNINFNSSLVNRPTENKNN